MKKQISIFSPDGMSRAGFATIALSAIVFLCSGLLDHKQTSGIFFINYLLSAGYSLAVIFQSKDKKTLTHTVQLLTLWFISAFALNRDMNVFDNSVTWLCVWICISVVALILASFYQNIAAGFRLVVFFFLGGALLLFVYYAIFLTPLYILSVPCILAVGISLHTYVPFFLVIVTVIIFIRATKIDGYIIYAFTAGIMLPLVLCTGFLIRWHDINRQISLILNQSTLNEGKLPAWVAVSQQIDRSPVAERIMKAGLVFHEADLSGNFLFGGMPSHSFDEPKQHDPLVVMATLFFQRPNLDEKERVKILASMYDARHHAQERLWSGDQLETANIITNVKLYPEYRMAYTEKTLTVKNNSNWQWGQQEAIYTFHLAEGSVISSLSLWINGEEQKSRLTTKAKADSAYKEVVGVESHDPSVVHWQEGNTVTVRVFPCTSQENRKFRIGITSPLRKDGNRLVYENVYFEGLAASEALETVQVSFSKKPAHLDVSPSFTETTKDVYQDNRTYIPYWEVTCDAPELSKTGFMFDDTAYQVKDYQPVYENFDAKTVYIDLNNSWTKDEFEQLYNKVKDKEVFVFKDKLIRLQAANLDEVYNLTCHENFSLFPVYEIADPDHALIISKSAETSPGLQDFEGSDFAKSLTDYLRQPKHIRFFNIGTGLTPYLKALKELRVFNYTMGSQTGLNTLLSRHQFVKDQENDSTVVINNASLIIQKANGIKVQDAPDHLLRLFAYNDIMKKTGANYFTNSYVQPDLIAEAEKAYIVSPVSSLLVLETQKDYKRFGIDENKNSLKNASMKSSGSVPEPHEWLLIVLAICIAIYLSYQSKGLKHQY